MQIHCISILRSDSPSLPQKGVFGIPPPMRKVRYKCDRKNRTVWQLNAFSADIHGPGLVLKDASGTELLLKTLLQPAALHIPPSAPAKTF